MPNSECDASDGRPCLPNCVPIEMHYFIKFFDFLPHPP